MGRIGRTERVAGHSEATHSEGYFLAVESSIFFAYLTTWRHLQPPLEPAVSGVPLSGRDGRLHFLSSRCTTQGGRREHPGFASSSGEANKTHQPSQRKSERIPTVELLER